MLFLQIYIILTILYKYDKKLCLYVYCSYSVSFYCNKELIICRRNEIDGVKLKVYKVKLSIDLKNLLFCDVLYSFILAYAKFIECHRHKKSNGNKSS